jgi:hypothetical protein
LVHNLGCVAHHMGDLEAADKQFKESLAMFIKLGNQRGMAECLASLSGIWRERGQTLPAVKLLGAAQSLLDATGATWWPADRVKVERNLENLKMTLDQKQFEAAWVSGNKMKLETAIAYAQKGEDDKAEGRQ